MSLRSIRIVTATETLDNTYDTFLLDASSGNITFTLSNIGNNGENYAIKRIDNTGNTITVQGYDSSQTIEGQVSLTLNPLDKINILSYNTVWYYFD